MMTVRCKHKLRAKRHLLRLLHQENLAILTHFPNIKPLKKARSGNVRRQTRKRWGSKVVDLSKRRIGAEEETKAQD